jgi:uncharacterized protein (TIGR02217 family)
MSNQVLPSLPGLSWNTKKKPIFKTTIREASSGREYRGTSWSTPRWEYTLSYEFLRQGMGRTELTQVVGFFNKHRGAWDSWLYQDPDDNAVTLQQFATGDGTTTSFQLVRDLGGFLEPVYEMNGAPVVYVQDWQGLTQCYSTSRTNLVLYSQAFNNAAWAKFYNGAGVTPVVTTGFTAPDGSTSAQRLQFSMSSYSAGSYSMVSQNMGYGTTYRSVWLKSNTGSNQYILIRDEVGLYQQVTVTTSWQRFSVYAPNTGAFQLGLREGYGALQPLSADVLAFGAQAEQSGTTTRYIGTAGEVQAYTDYTIGALGTITFTQAPVTSSLLKWSGQYYWRCRFSDDYIEPSKFMKDLYDLRQLKFITVKP